MPVIDLDERNKELFSLCLEDWSPEAREGGPRRLMWVNRFLEKGLRAKLAVDDNGSVGGMIQYLPIEQSFVSGAGLEVILCIWVHGHKQGRGNFQGRGLGTELIAAAEQDARERGVKGMAAWGLWLPFWMKASWFKKRGYQNADRQGMARLVWKSFAPDAKPPKWRKKGKQLPDQVLGKVNVVSFVNGWCMAANLAAERARRAAAEFGDQVAYREIDTGQQGAVARWGFSDALFIDGKEVAIGPPPSYEKIRSRIANRVRRL